MCKYVCLCLYVFLELFLGLFFLCFFALSYSGLFYFILLLLFFQMSVSILMKESVDLGGRESGEDLGEVGRRETTIRAYSMENLFSLLKQALTALAED